MALSNLAGDVQSWILLAEDRKDSYFYSRQSFQSALGISEGDIHALRSIGAVVFPGEEDRRFRNLVRGWGTFGTIPVVEVLRYLKGIQGYVMEMKVGTLREVAVEARRLILTDQFCGLCEVSDLLKKCGADVDAIGQLRRYIRVELGSHYIYLHDAWAARVTFMVRTDGTVVKRAGEPDQRRGPWSTKEWNQARAVWLDQFIK